MVHGGEADGAGTYLLAKSPLEPPISWDGEPEPERVGFAILPEPKPPESPNGDRKLDPLVGSLGEWLVAGEVDRP